MKKKYILSTLFFQLCIMVCAQTSLTNDSLCNKLVILNQKRELSSEAFDTLCKCIKNKTVITEKICIVRFEGTIYPIVQDSIPYRLYIENKRKPEAYCNGYYWISSDINVNISDNFLVGVNSQLNGLNCISSSVPHFRRWIQGGFKRGISECIWRYEISAINDKIFKYENYKHGLLDGDYTILTTNNDTLYHTQFRNGSGYYIDYYPNGKIQLEGKVKEGKADGRWLFYLYNKDEELTNIYLENFEKGESISLEVFTSTLEINKNKEQERLIQKNRKRW